MIENGSLVREDVPDDTCNSMITFFMERSVKFFFLVLTIFHGKKYSLFVSSSEKMQMYNDYPHQILDQPEAKIHE